MKQSTAVAMVLAIAVGGFLGVWFTRKPAGPAAAKPGAKASGRPSASPGTSAAPPPRPEAPEPVRGAPAAPQAAGGEPEEALDPRFAYLLGVVVDASGKPFQGAHLKAQKSARVTSGDEGKFRLGPLDPEPVVQLELEAAGHLTERLEVGAPQGGLYDIGTLRLSEGAVLEGRARYPDSRPAYIGVRAEAEDPVKGEAVPSGTTQSDGAFRLAGLRPGRYVVVAEKGQERAARDVVIEHPTGVVKVDDFVLAARRGPAEATVRVKVLGPDGNPLAGADVRATAHGKGDSQATGPDGTATVQVPAGKVIVNAVAPGVGGAATSSVEVPAGGATDLELRLSAGGIVAGRVEGQITADATVLLIGDAGGAPPGTPVYLRCMAKAIAPDATFELTHVAPGTYRIMVNTKPAGLTRAPDIESREVTVREGEVARVDLRTASLVRTRVRATGLTADELAGAQTYFKSEGVLLRLHAAGSPSQLEVDLPDGPLTLWILIDVPAGQLHLTRDLPAPRGETVEVAFPPQRGWLSGLVPSALAYEGASATATGPEAEATARVGPTGRFRFPALPPGSYRISAPGCVPREVTVEAGRHFEVPLEAR